MEKYKSTCFYIVDPEFIDNFEIDLIAGRTFSAELATDIGNTIIINEKAAQVLELGSAAESIGKILMPNNQAEVTVIGVVRDFNFRTLEDQIGPIALFYQPGSFRFANIGFIAEEREKFKTFLADTWKKFDKIHPIDYLFLKDVQDEMDKQMSSMIGMIAGTGGFVMLIALLGLLGMATYTTEMRTKEIGIRKVMGASVSDVIYTLSKDYLKPILYSAVFALPGGYFLAEAGYQFVANRPDLSLWVPVGVFIFVLISALFTISLQTVKAAMTTPAATLREE